MSDCHGAAVSAVESASPAETGSGARTIALVGPPNSGKSTLFNLLTGLRQKVANFPGVTVEQHAGEIRLAGGRSISLIDLPGVYSLTARSEDERVTCNVLRGEMPGTPRPDAVLLVLDSTNLERHLLLAAPVLRLQLPALVILNMADDLRGRGGQLNAQALSAQLGAPVALVSAARGEGMERVWQFLEGVSVSVRGSGAPLLQLPVLQDVPKCREWAKTVGRRASYQAPAPSLWTARLDSVFLHPIAGPLVFLAVVIAVFQSIFTGARPLMEAVETFIVWSGFEIGALLPQGWIRSLVIDGIWSGVGSVIVFLPQILLLFLFIVILEDSGYLARAALIADRTMRRAGLQGKSFIPLLSAYACAVPAILSTRTIENRRDRIATILIAPFMTCSARLPIYALLIAAFVPERPVLGQVLGTRAAALLGLYALGFLAAYATARMLKSSVLRSDRMVFILEMPPYRTPTLRSVLLRLFDRTKVFLRRAGTVILAVAILLWALASFPLENGHPPRVENSLVGKLGRAIEPAIAPLGFNWRIGVGLITSLAAREVIVASLGTLYGMESTSRSIELQEALRRDLTPAAAAALLVFFAFAMQCMSTVAVVRRETGGWTWPAVQFAYMSMLAYAGAFVTYRAFTWLA